MGGDSQWQSATTDESQQCAFKTYKRREKRTDFKNAFQALQEGSLKTMNGNQSKNLPSSQLCYSEGTVLIVQIFISSTQKVTELFLS